MEGFCRDSHIYEVIMTKERAQYINSVHTCSLCSIVLLQYVATIGANRPENKDQCLKPMYTAWLSFL